MTEPEDASVRTLRHPEPVANVPVGVAVLLVSAGLEGLALALSALVLHIITGSAMWDGAASLLIGLLLLVLAHVVPVDGADLPASIGRLRRRLLAVPAISAVEVTPVERAS